MYYKLHCNSCAGSKGASCGGMTIEVAMPSQHDCRRSAAPSPRGSDALSEEIMTALTGYGLMIGKIIESRPPRLGHPHWLLWVQSGEPKHPAYRVAANLQSSKRGD